MPITGNRGVRKVNERIVANGRAIIITEKDKDKYQWEDIPVGSKFIDTATGVEMVKLEGESDWVPAGLKNDGTLCISKDTITVVEVFTIVNTDDGDGNFTYANKRGEYRHKPILNDGSFVFEVEEGSFQRYRNHLEVIIDDTLHRSTESGDVVELNDRRFALHETLHVDQEITVKYYKQFRIGQPYPRIFIGDDDPSEAEIGDLHIDTNYSLGLIDPDDPVSDINNVENLRNTFSQIGHEHTVSDITDFPASLPAAGGVADAANKLTTSRNIALSGVVTGTALFNGTADAVIQTSYDDELLAQKVKNIIGIDDLIDYINKNTSKVNELCGEINLDVDIKPEDNFMLPVPDGCVREKCIFKCEPVNVVDAPFYINCLSNGLINDTKNVKSIKYTVTHIVNKDQNNENQEQGD